jgi:hypothetical protein
MRKSTLFLAAATIAVPVFGSLLFYGPALAQRPAAVYDLSQLPVTKGVVAQYTLTPRGDVDGLILTDGTEVHIPPFLSTQLVFAVKPGDAVTIQGLKAKVLPMVAAAVITNDATKASVTAGTGGGPRMMLGGDSLEATGRIKAVLHDPRSEINGVLLEDGTTIRLPPPEAKKLATQLAVGQTIFARGPGLNSPLGHAVFAREIGPNKDSLTKITVPPMHEHGRPGMMRDKLRGG